MGRAISEKPGHWIRKRHTMRPRYIFATIGSVAVFFVILVMLATGFIPPDAVSLKSSPSAVNSQTPESVQVQADAGVSHSSTSEPPASPVAPELDPPSLLKSHCAQCHVTRSLERFKKTQAEWETTLAKMETMGVRLDEAEKVVLLEYLAVADKP
jgi:hypothetical protein